jgi:hypothetical protein
MTERPPLLEEGLPREAGDIADASASVPSSSGYRATLQTLFRGKMSGAAIALVLRQVVIMALNATRREIPLKGVLNGIFRGNDTSMLFGKKCHSEPLHISRLCHSLLKCR